jgi:Asp-tRNA(Asn)/Glu-tRNA(Gln) amidotransferase A subunit family amidase
VTPERCNFSSVAALNRTYRAFSHFAPESEFRNAGFTVSVKGNIPVKGLPWTEGSALYADRVAQHDAAVVARARKAGGVVLGTTTLSELAMYGVTNPFEPMGLNPWNVERTAGGSSTGAGVAAALGMAQVNIGTDSGGSIRNPACHCGVVGFMPRIGALPLEGTPNHTPSLSTIGLIARSVPDVETAYRALADAGPAPQPARRLIVLHGLIERTCDEETQALFFAAIAKTDLDLVEAEIPGWLEGERAAGVVSLYESGRALAHMDLSRASDGIRARAAAAATLSQEDVDRAKAACAALKENVAKALQTAGADAIATPTWPFAAPYITEHTVKVRGTSVPIDPHRNCFVRAANAIDACAITLPMGLYPSAGVPAGLHLMANGGSEPRLLALARMIEIAIPPLPPAPPLQSGERRFA